MFDRNFNFNLRRDSQKISYERRAYESVERKEPILGYVTKNDEKKNPDKNGLTSKNVYMLFDVAVYMVFTTSHERYIYLYTDKRHDNNRS